MGSLGVLVRCVGGSSLSNPINDAATNAHAAMRIRITTWRAAATPVDVLPADLPRLLERELDASIMDARSPLALRAIAVRISAK
jgi:hypothetical protein